jgi:thiosulfate reductase cytochrome b subunit
MKKIHLHGLPIRLWHWLNVLMAIPLIITGIQIRVPGIADLGRHSTPLLVHKYLGWAMVATFLFWLVYNLASGNLRRHYRVKSGDLRGSFAQAKYYLIAIFKGEENPFRPTSEEKFNPLQKFAYGTVMGIFTPILVITGIFLSDVLFFRKYVLLWNVMGTLDALHVIGAYALVLYLVVHIYMATLGPKIFSHVKAMIVGYEEEPEKRAGEGA